MVALQELEVEAEGLALAFLELVAAFLVGVGQAYPEAGQEFLEADQACLEVLASPDPAVAFQADILDSAEELAGLESEPVAASSASEEELELQVASSFEDFAGHLAEVAADSFQSERSQLQTKKDKKN